MKRQITFLSLLLVLATTLFSCKKDETSVKARMMGKWSVAKIETSGYTAADLAGDPTKINGTITGLSADYMDFKSNNDDQIELSIKGNRTIGTYIGTGEAFNMTFAEGDYYCTVNNLSSTQFQFTAKLDKTNVVKVYYLTR